ncbi:hypothetical protein FLAVO9AF_170019 [Flavobacterium sp. 9AF]|nr:hypothetical protein FLAVO9AF_170019 [Flavobacterium sp. 9AF]
MKYKVPLLIILIIFLTCKKQEIRNDKNTALKTVYDSIKNFKKLAITNDIF